MKTFLRRFIISLGIIGLLSACEEEELSTVPNTGFRVYIDLEDATYFGFDIGSSIALDESIGGYAGIILYYASLNNIKAFDLCCPIHVDDKEELEIDGATAFCPTDSIYFILTDDPPHSLSSDTSIFFMRSYQTSLNDGILTVYN